MKFLKILLLASISVLLHVPVQSQEYLVSLKSQRLKVAINNFTLTDVIDAREEKCCIGYVYGGYQNRRLTVNVEDGIKASFHALLKSGFKDGTENIPLLIKINKLFVYEFKSNENTTAVLEINIDFYTQENGSYFYEFMAGHYINFSGENPRSNIDKMIAKATEKCCTEFLHRMKLGLGYHQKTDEKEVYENSLKKTIVVSTRSRNRKNCIYYSFNGFRDNLADTITNFYPKNIRENYDIRGFQKFKFVSSEIETDEVWGVYFDKNLYIKIDDIFIPVIVTDTEYIIKNMIAFHKNQNLLYGAGLGFFITFGAVGGAIIGVGIGALSHQKSEISDIDYRIDMATGMPIPLGELHYLKYESELIFFTNKFKGQCPDLYINGKKECSFKPDSYFSFLVTPEINPVEICLKSNSNEYCETVSADIFNTMFFEAVIKNNGKVSLFEHKSPSMRSSITNLIEKGKIARLNSSE